MLHSYPVEGTLDLSRGARAVGAARWPPWGSGPCLRQRAHATIVWPASRRDDRTGVLTAGRSGSKEDPIRRARSPASRKERGFRENGVSVGRWILKPLDGPAMESWLETCPPARMRQVHLTGRLCALSLREFFCG